MPSYGGVPMIYIMAYIYPSMNQLDKVLHILAFGVNTCSLSMVVSFNIALLNSPYSDVHKIFILNKESKKIILI